MSVREQLLSLLRARSFERRPVVLASGKSSDWYVDVKQTALYAPAALLLGRELFASFEKLGDDVAIAAGLELGAVPLIDAVLHEMTCRWGRDGHGLIVRKFAKGHGTQAAIEGLKHVPADVRAKGAIVLEDVATTGGSALQAVFALRDEGIHVRGVVAVVDREEGAAAAFAKAGLHFTSLYGRADFMS